MLQALLLYPAYHYYVCEEEFLSMNHLLSSEGRKSELLVEAWFS
jgi:hypothetical protein